MKDWFEICRVGTFTAMDGRKVDFTEAKLDFMAASYRPEEHEAPLVVGHPKDNAPAYGWVAGLKRVGDRLLAKPKQVVQEFADAVKQGLYKKRSISIYPDGTLRHVGFLGAKPPAIKGLADIDFAEDGETVTINFGDEDEDMNELEQLKAKLAAEQKARKAAEQRADEAEAKAKELGANFAEAEKKQKRQEIEHFIAQGIKDGKILPAWKEDGLADFLEQLDENGQTFDFAEGKEQTPGQWFRDFIGNFAEHPLFKTMAKPEGDENKPDDFAEAEADAKEMVELAG